MANPAAVVGGHGVEVFVNHLGDAPWCQHGPTMLFERFFQDREPQRFFACAAYRKRSGCPFFHLASEKETTEKRQMRKEIYQAARDAETAHDRLYGNTKNALEKAGSLSTVCTKCSYVVFKTTRAQHQGHKLVEKLPPTRLICPTQFLPALEDSHSHAQYLFSTKATSCILDNLQRQGIRHIVCIGAPRIHEAILSARLGKQEPLKDMRSFLLDWDRRFATFFSPKEFQHFNMFNHHFFDAECGPANLKKFLSQATASSVAVVIDPPFGGLARPLAACLEWLYGIAEKSCKKASADTTEPAACTTILNSASGTDPHSLATVWVFPYFLEGQVLEAMPSMQMMDYKVDYDNHPLFTSVGRKAAEKRKSPVRLFTNITGDLWVLPAAEGYRLCRRCRRYVASENKHCVKCDGCSTKHGLTYSHCDKCKMCVKPGRVHCSTCHQCLPATHVCRSTEDSDGAAVAMGPTCHRCGKAGHKRRYCPEDDKEMVGPTGHRCGKKAGQKRQHRPEDEKKSPSVKPKAKRMKKR